MLPEAVFSTLMALSEGEMDRFEIAAATGFHVTYLGQISQGMVARGWIGRHGRGGARVEYGPPHRWWITERGKIVLAIECGRRTKLRAKGIQPGYGPDRQRVKEFRYGNVA